MIEPGDENRDHNPHPSGGESVAVQFVREMAIFLAGLFLGFFWYMYIREEPGADAHIIIGLLVIIFGLIRYVLLLRRQRER